MKAKSKPSRPRKTAGRARRPYRSPKLTTYGDVRQLTDNKWEDASATCAPDR